MESSVVQVHDPLQIIATAVTPVVMISATAILIGGIASKHQALSDRMRQLTAEFRSNGTTEQRRANVRLQIALFQRRLSYVSIAHVSLFAATACFISMVIVLAFTVRISTLVAATLPSFLVGVALLLIAVVFEIRELLLSSQTARLEIASAFDASHRPDPSK